MIVAYSLRKFEVFRVADGEICLDGVKLRDRRQHGLRVDQIADLRGRLSRNAGDERSNLRESQIQFRVGNGSLSGGDRGLSRLNRCLALGFLLSIVVELALRDSTRLRKRGIASYIDLRQFELRLRLQDLPSGLCQLAFALVEGRLKWASVNFKEHLSFGNLSAFLVILFHEISIGLRLNLGIHVPIEGGHPFTGNGHIRRLELHKGDRQRWRRPSSSGVLVATARKQYGAEQKRDRTASTCPSVANHDFCHPGTLLVHDLPASTPTIFR